MSTLEEQLTEVFSRGLDNDPELRASLEEALNSSMTNDQTYTKAEANYRSEGSDDEECGKCVHFDGNSRCAIVSGNIDANDVCDYFVRASDTSELLDS